VQQVLGDAPVVFLNGACGDVNPAWIEQRYDEAGRVGSIVGAEAARRLLELRPLGAQQKVWSIRWDELSDKPVTSGALVDEPRIRVLSREVPLPLRRLDTPESYSASLAKYNMALGALPPADVEGRRRVMESIVRYRTEREVALRLRPGDAQHFARAEVQAIALGKDCAVLGLPGEFFVETAQQIQQAAGIEHLLVACYANHYVGYLVPKHEFERGGYEPGVAIVDETCEEAVRVAAIDLLRELMAT
jgi:hypothetical protein